MSYSDKENSIEEGEPVELYRFLIGATSVCFASTPFDVLHDGLVYKASSIKRDRVKQTQDAFKNGVNLSLPREDAFAARLITGSIRENITVTIYRKHMNDGQVIALFKGRYSGVIASGNDVKLEIESIFAGMKRTGLRACYQTQCRHALYSTQCGVSKSDHKVIMIVTSVNGEVIGVNASTSPSENLYLGGIASFGVEQVQIIAQTEFTITLASEIQGLKLGSEIGLYKSCDLRISTCTNRFANEDNFGGFAAMPQKNPFVGSIF